MVRTYWMFYLSKPGQELIKTFLSRQKNHSLSYKEVGSSRNGAPKGYAVDHNRAKLGQGSDAFERAKNAVRQWKMFEIPWINLCWPDVRIEKGATVAILVSHFGFWSINASRIVYVIEESGAVEKYGFAYGTLQDHGEIGEERFTVELNHADESVWYDLYAFSRPRLAARAAYPFSRSIQKRFAQESKEAMRRAVQLA